MKLVCPECHASNHAFMGGNSAHEKFICKNCGHIWVEPKLPKKTIVMVGDPLAYEGGFTFHGPFDNESDAEQWVTNNAGRQLVHFYKLENH